MLKRILKILSPELLKVLCEMGHGVIKKADERGENAVGQIERFGFYEEATKDYAIIATGESALYANITLQKGVVAE